MSSSLIGVEFKSGVHKYLEFIEESLGLLLSGMFSLVGSDDAKNG